MTTTTRHPLVERVADALVGAGGRIVAHRAVGAVDA